MLIKMVCDGWGEWVYNHDIVPVPRVGEHFKGDGDLYVVEMVTYDYSDYANKHILVSLMKLGKLEVKQWPHDNFWNG